MSVSRGESGLARRGGVLVAVALILAVVITARLYVPRDTPFTPRDGAEVLEHVAAGPAQSKARNLEAQLARSPSDLAIAVPLVREYLSAVRRTGDARLLSYAEAALAPWWSLPTPPPQALLLRAIIEQTRHEFAASLTDLDRLVELTPTDPQAWLTRATVLGVLARYDEAMASCKHLDALTRSIIAVVCKASIVGSTGHADEALRALGTAIAERGVDPAEVSWARSVRGEISLYAGDPRAAETDLRAALAADPDDVYTRGLLADVLLDAHRDSEVLAIVTTDEVNEVLLLRRAIAARRTRAADADALSQRLHATTSALRERGDATHQREEARLLLEVDGDARAALPVAVANWKVQHEPWDARVLLASAAQAGDRDAAAPALAWVRATGCAWLPVTALVEKLGAP